MTTQCTIQEGPQPAARSPAPSGLAALRELSPQAVAAVMNNDQLKVWPFAPGAGTPRG